jgi:predicted Zn-dependent protease
MRAAVSVLVLLFVSQSAIAQQALDMFPDIGPTVDEVAKSLVNGPTKRGIKPYEMPHFFIQISNKPGINAFALVAEHTIVLQYDLVRILKDSRGELAFVIAHEIGHVEDVNCRQRGARQGLSGPALQRMCETTADFIGLEYIMAAGYNPSDAAAVMGRLILANTAGEGTITGILLGRFKSDHPVDIDRIQRITTYANTICAQRPEICAR